MLVTHIKIIPDTLFTLYEDGGSALRGVSGNLPGRASFTVVSTFLIRYWLVVCSELTLSPEKEEPGYPNAKPMLGTLPPVLGLHTSNT